MFVLPFHDAGAEWGRSSRCSLWGLEAVLFDLGGGPVDLDGRSAESEGLWLGDWASVLDLLTLAVLSGAERVNVLRVAWRWAPSAGARRHGAEARSIGCRLRAKLGEVKIGAGLVSDSHRLSELPLGPESVKDDAVDDDAERLNDDLDDAAYECPILKAAGESIGDIVFEEMTPLVIHARPAPHVLAIALGFALVEDTGANCPHDDAENEEGDGEYGVVSGHLFCSPVTSTTISD